MAQTNGREQDGHGACAFVGFGFGTGNSSSSNSIMVGESVSGSSVVGLNVGDVVGSSVGANDGDTNMVGVVVGCGVGGSGALVRSDTEGLLTS